MADPNVGSNQLTHWFTVQSVRPAGPSRASKLWLGEMSYEAPWKKQNEIRFGNWWENKNKEAQ